MSNYQGLISGNYGNSSTTTQPMYQNRGATALGGGIAGALGGSNLFGAFPETLGALGLTSGSTAGIGGLLGALSAFSDIRLKEYIVPDGEENGYPVYLFSYKNDPLKRRYRGVMAQDVVKALPEAVSVIDGYMAVNYGMIGVNMVQV